MTLRAFSESINIELSGNIYAEKIEATPLAIQRYVKKGKLPKELAAQKVDEDVKKIIVDELLKTYTRAAANDWLRNETQWKKWTIESLLTLATVKPPEKRPKEVVKPRVKFKPVWEGLSATDYDDLKDYVKWYIWKYDPPRKAQPLWGGRPYERVLTVAETEEYQQQRKKNIWKGLKKAKSIQLNTLKLVIPKIDLTWQYFHPLEKFRKFRTREAKEAFRKRKEIEFGNVIIPMGEYYHPSIGWY